MFSGKKCQRCESKIKDSFDFCPSCGLDLRDPDKDVEDFGVLGKNNELVGNPLVGGGGLGITDRMVNSLFRSLMKSFEQQMKESQSFDPEVQNLPNGIKIRFGPVQQRKKQAKKQVKKKITEDQINRMSGLPRVEAKTDVRRLSDKVVYELQTPGLSSAEDVFISKLESGYEVKVIGKKKVFVNSLPVNLPLKGYSVKNSNVNVEFGLH